MDAARYKCREVGGRKSKWAMEGCWSHTAGAGWTRLNRPGAGGKGPLAGFRYQDARAGRRGWTLVLPSLEFVSVADA